MAKVKMTQVGQPCRKCGTAVTKKTPAKRQKRAKQAYVFDWYLHCPKCKTVYLVESAKRWLQEDHPSQQSNRKAKPSKKERKQRQSRVRQQPKKPLTVEEEEQRSERVAEYEADVEVERRARDKARRGIKYPSPPSQSPPEVLPGLDTANLKGACNGCGANGKVYSFGEQRICSSCYGKEELKIALNIQRKKG